MTKTSALHSLIFGTAALLALIPAKVLAQSATSPQQAAESALGQKILRLQCGPTRAVIDLEQHKRLLIGNNQGDERMWGYFTAGKIDTGEVWKREFAFKQKQKDGQWSVELEPEGGISQDVQDAWTAAADKIIYDFGFDRPPSKKSSMARPGCTLRANNLPKIAAH